MIRAKNIPSQCGLESKRIK